MDEDFLDSQLEVAPRVHPQLSATRGMSGRIGATPLEAPPARTGRVNQKE
jgi:hypothetical protein